MDILPEFRVKERKGKEKKRKEKNRRRRITKCPSSLISMPFALHVEEGVEWPHHLLSYQTKTDLLHAANIAIGYTGRAYMITT
jgi:hypothetical protein